MCRKGFKTKGKRKLRNLKLANIKNDISLIIRVAALLGFTGIIRLFSRIFTWLKENIISRLEAYVGLHDDDL